MKLKSPKFLIIIFLIVLIVILFFLSLLKRTSNPAKEAPFPVFSPSGSPTKIPRVSIFSVVSTVPENNQRDIYPGEIDLSFTADKVLSSEADFSLDISPALPYYWRFTNSYPTNTVTAKIVGGLKTNTTYAVSVFNSAKVKIYSWSFTTSSTAAESTSSLIRDEELQLDQKYFPLFNYLPYSNNDFDVIYIDRFTLQVSIKNPDVNKVKQEVIDWIKSKGVDPNTHTINYVNAF